MKILNAFIRVCIGRVYLRRALKYDEDLLDFLEECICVEQTSAEMEWIKAHSELMSIYTDFEYSLGNYRNRLSQMKDAIGSWDIPRIQILRESWESGRNQLEKVTDNFMKQFLKIAMHENMLLSNQMAMTSMAGIKALNERNTRYVQNVKKV